MQLDPLELQSHHTPITTCVDVAVLAGVLGRDDGSHVRPAQRWEQAELSVEAGDVIGVAHHHHHLTTQTNQEHKNMSIKTMTCS